MKLSLSRWRLVSQLLALVALNPLVYRVQAFCVPVLNCWACPLAAFSCPVGVAGNYLARGLIPWMTLGTMMLAGAAFGRLLCGWACPFGLLQDLLFRLRTYKLALPGFFRYGKYAFLVVTVLLVPRLFGIGPTPGHTGPEDAFFCNYCPAATLESAIPRTAAAHWQAREAAATRDTSVTTDPASAPVPAEAGESPQQPAEAPATGAAGAVPEGAGFLQLMVSSPRVWILVSVLVAFVFIKRPFCRAACPIGAALALFNRTSLYQMRLWPEKCVQCGRCRKVCPVDFYLPGDPSTPECIRCLECKGCCPTGAIR